MPPLTVRQLTSAYELRYQNTAHVPHRDFSQGMIRDIASWEAPEGAMWDAVDMLCDYVGKVRKRGGTTSPASGNSAATVENVIGYASNGKDGLTGLFGSVGKGPGQVYIIDRSTGAATSIGPTATNTTFAGRPFQHGNLMVFPFQILGYTSSDTNALFFAGGSTAASVGNLGVTSSITAGDNRVTSISTSPLLAGHVGALIEVDGASNTYRGRITEVTGPSACRVEPTPVDSITGINFFVNPIFSPGQASSFPSATGRFGVSYQNRIVLGYTVSTTLSLSSSWAKGWDPKPNRIIWSQLPTEAIPLGGLVGDGQAELFPYAFTGPSSAPYYNFLDFPGLGPTGITAVAVAGEGNLIVFGARQMYRVTGTLDTETTQSPAFDFTEGLVSANVGCIAQRSLQYTQGGLVFAAYDNLYRFDGSAMQPLLTGRNQRYFQARLRAGATILGSAYFLNTNHYYLSLSDADSSLMLNLDTYALCRETNVLLFDSTPDPSDATKLWGVRYWDTTGAAPTMTKGQLIRLDPIFLPAQANASDADGTAVLPVIQTKSYMDGTLEVNKLFTQLHVDYALQGTGSPTATVTADTKLNTSEASYNALTQGTLTNTGTGSGVQHMDVTNQLAEGKAFEAKITVNAACAVFELSGLNIGMQQRALT